LVVTWHFWTVRIERKKQDNNTPQHFLSQNVILVDGSWPIGGGDSTTLSPLASHACILHEGCCKSVGFD